MRAQAARVGWGVLTLLALVLLCSGAILLQKSPVPAPTPAAAPLTTAPAPVREDVVVVAPRPPLPGAAATTPPAMAAPPPPAPAAPAGRTSAAPVPPATTPPTGFPWPPPVASATMVLPEENLPPAERSRLADFDRALRRALRAGGYTDLSYFAVPSGFAIVTRVERVGLDGTPAPALSRWAGEGSSAQTLSLVARLQRFFLAQPGHFRILVFVVSPEPFAPARRRVTREEAVAWLDTGTNVLPVAIAERTAERGLAATVLVYEFLQPEKDRPAELERPGHSTALQHLVKSGVWAALTR